MRDLRCAAQTKEYYHYVARNANIGAPNWLISCRKKPNREVRHTDGRTPFIKLSP